MKCPFCAHTDTQVVDSRVMEAENSIRRRRRCVRCENRFTTFETADLHWPMVIKSNGTRMAFDENKLRQGFERALHKRSVPAEVVDKAVERICHNLLQSAEREVTSNALGEKVMAELIDIDPVAYVRFASVYKIFTDVAEFQRIIAKLPNKPTEE